ncbi:hypothetical protein CDV31_004001 [Fusarium ambrosium]|uniref:HIG1 domain-containing protein n=1 Tax=Fusarium ambrosium TaxID=131363 RepID=A0A428US44_9HYPO|nr:hypothetical protein CDV31_004001 [Fusarium ambrosium]
MLSPAVISALDLLVRAPRVNTKACSGKPISEVCPVEATTLGYNPNLGANIFFVVAFGLCALGGGLAAAGAFQNDPGLSEKGNSANMARVALQVVVLVAFGVIRYRLLISSVT